MLRFNAQRADFETITRNITIEARLIDDRLDLTRIAHDKRPLELKFHDLPTLLPQTISALQQEWKKKRLKRTTRLDAPAATVAIQPAPPGAARRGS